LQQNLHWEAAEIEAKTSPAGFSGFILAIDKTKQGIPAALFQGLQAINQAPVHACTAQEKIIHFRGHAA
jgi:hypothetical protein